MARYRIDESGPSLEIELTEVEGQEADLLRAFSECQAGQCSCPTDEYQKLAAMEVEQGHDAIRLTLDPKPGEKFDATEIAACLDYTTAKATSSGSEASRQAR